MAVTATPARQASKFILENIAYTGQNQNTIKLDKGLIIHAMNLHINAKVDVTAATLNRNPVGLMNAIKKLEIGTKNGKIIHRLSGQDLIELFGKQFGVSGESKDLPAGGAALSDQVAYQYVKFPFFLNDGQRADDGCLQTFTQDINVTIEWNTPTAAGTLYGTPTGLNIDELGLQIELDTWRCNTVEEQKFLKGIERTILTQDVTSIQTNDALQVRDLPNNEMYRKVTFLPRSTVNNMTQGNPDIIVANKTMSVKKTFEQTSVMTGLVRGFRSDSVQKREDSGLAAGAVEVDFLRLGSMIDFMPSTQSSELFFELPVLNTGVNPFIRVVSDIARNQG